MVSFTILAGGYDVFVAAYLFNPATSSLSLVSKSPTGPNPSWISQHPTNRSILYAVNEVAEGALQSFAVDEKGTLSPAVDTVGSGGDSPAFAAALSTGDVAVFNYNSGNGRIVPTTSSGLAFDASAPTIKFPIISPSGVSHPHMALQNGIEVLVPDLGGDTIWRLAKVFTNGYSIVGSIPQPKGSGPRHIAIYGDRLFTLHELSSTLSVQAIPAFPNGTSPLLASVSIVPADPPAGAVYAAAEILIPAPSPRFPKPYIYVSNRNTGVQDARGDSIAIFEHVRRGVGAGLSADSDSSSGTGETLRLVRQVFTGIDQIRGMEFGPADRGGDEFLVAAGVAGSAGTLVFRRTEGGTNLELVAKNLDIPTRTSFVWL